ncbi:MAG: AI-2E family transporter [Jatrophihabitans sp.]|nr:MAG: AI-2E family transporter [Jatrophihabitans sp.]
MTADEPDLRDVAAAATPAEHHLRAARGGGESLFEAAPGGRDRDNPFGQPGPPLSRAGAFYRGFFTAIGVLVALVLGLAVREVASVLVLVLVAVFLAVGLNPIVELLIRRGVRRHWAVLLVSLLVVGVIAVVATVLVTVIQNQISSFVDDLPHLVGDLRRNRTIDRLDQHYHFLKQLEDGLSDPNLLHRVFGGAFNIGLSVLGALVNTVVIVVMTVYFLAALPQVKRAAYSLAPASRRGRVAQLGDEVLRRVGGYVIGAVLVAMLAGTVTLVLMFSVGLGEYAVPLALLVALLDLVPLVGSLLGAATVTVVGFATSVHVGIIVFVVYLLYEPTEGYVIYPRVMRSTVDVPEIVTIVAVLLGGALAGVVGALLALPTAAAVLLLVREVWVRRQDMA